MSVELSVGVALSALVVGVALGLLWARRRATDAAAAAEQALRQSMSRLQARAADAEREVTAISEELDQFAYIASHDLRAPLRAVANLAGFLKEDISDQIPEDSAKHLDMILQRVARLDASILGLLAYSRVNRNEESAVVSDIDSLILRSVKDHSTSKTTLRFDNTQLSFPVAPNRFMKTLGFLVSNAEAHHDQDDVELRIHAALLDDHLRLSIADDGPGIEPRHHERVFELFSTLRARDRVESSGMGLAIVAKTMRQIGGSVSLRSDPSVERGTTVELTWPAEALSSEMSTP